MGLRAGDIVDGKYRIERVLGRGGMGTVYEAHHISIRRRVAVKILRAAMAADAEMVQRFEREALAASSVRSRHVVEVYDVGELDSGERFIILEYLDGESLSVRLKRCGLMSPAELFPLAAQLLDGLAAAHSAGIVHRDLKPANIFICRGEGEEELVKVLDFGVSKFSALSSEAFTQTGALIGTPHYMAPELTEGASRADARSDVYGVGAILFRALTGRTPYTAETIHELIAKLIRSDPERLAEAAPHLPVAVTQLIDRALAKSPAERFADARAMAAAVRSVVRDSALLDESFPTPANPVGSESSWQIAPPPSGAPGDTLGASGLPTLVRRPPAHGPPPPGVESPRPSKERAEQSVATGEAPDPQTLVTPSPATLDSGALGGRRRPKAWLLGVGLGMVLAVGAGAVLFGGGPTTSPVPAAGSAPPVASDAAVSDEEVADAEDSDEEGSDDSESGEEPVASTNEGADDAGPSSSAEPVASSPPPAVHKAPPPPPVPRPKAPRPAPRRDFREDL